MTLGSTRFDEIVVSPPFPREPFDSVDEDTEDSEEDFTGAYFAVGAGIIEWRP